MVQRLRADAKSKYPASNTLTTAKNSCFLFAYNSRLNVLTAVIMNLLFLLASKSQPATSVKEMTFY